ncbi:MAG: acyloxyacyl hydrolase [Chitinophagales bacterium]|nr:acyloxyacyl hydrolase [Chitinophagaceae bacterium]MCB9064149.1 acyloxyacyl hydrolase [Chitinophagales bacterium]
MKRRQILLTISLLLLASLSFAQEKWAGVGVDVNLSAGKIFRHSKKFPTQLPSVVTGLDINIIQQTDGRKDWQIRRRYPQVGMGLMYTNYGIDSIYGKCFGLYPNIQIPLVRYKNFEWAIRAGFGLGYVTKRYTRYPNFDTINTAIGSRMNNFSIFATDARYRINQHWDIQVGAYFTHISNAALRTPNLGINSYGARVGIRYFPVSSEPKKITKEVTPLKNRWLAQVRLSYASREEYGADGPTYPVYLVSAFASKRYWSKNKLILGLDYSYHGNMYAFLRNNEIEVGRERANSWKSAVIVGNEYLIGRVGVLLQLGFYIKQYYLPEDFFYQKLGGNVYILQKETGILKELSLSILLKTHKFSAELTEVGLGFSF